jgi:hypothetical protein
MLNRQKLQSFIDSYKDKFIKDLDETCKDLLDTNDTNLIDLDQEYDIPQCDYIKSEPMIHLDVDKLVLDIDNNKCDIHNLTRNELIMKYNKIYNSNNYSNGNDYIGSHRSLKINFPINVILNKNEYVIKLYLVSINNKMDSYNNKIDSNVSTLSDYHYFNKSCDDQNNCKVARPAAETTLDQGNGN